MPIIMNNDAAVKEAVKEVMPEALASLQTRTFQIRLSLLELGIISDVLHSIETASSKVLTKNSTVRLTSYLVNIAKIKYSVKLVDANLIGYTKTVTLPEGDVNYTFNVGISMALEMGKKKP